MTGTGKLKKIFPQCNSAISLASKADADVKLAPNDIVQIGKHQLEVRPTPGHTNGKKWINRELFLSRHFDSCFCSEYNCGYNLNEIYFPCRLCYICLP